ncbi:MAG: hypothetical protein AUJ49_04180 [Desulfovibrionaceae bacterium CG1_02_65_16]|nr:MAG: hypothetical protein AUJ49_04180 [Desulfovibrionaceae bacterium CG1_02_65_16]
MNTTSHTLVSATLALLAGLLLCGCGSAPTSYYSTLKRTVVDAKDDVLGTTPTSSAFFNDDDTPLTSINYDAADTMMGMFSPALNKNSPIYYENFTNRVDMNDAAPFGALVAEQVAARLAMRNFRVTAGKPRLIKDEGPNPLLTNDIDPRTPQEKLAKAQAERDMDQPPQACLLSGDYFVAGRVIYITAKVTALAGGQIMAAHSWVAPLNRSTRAMLPRPAGNAGMTPSVRTSLGTSPHRIANPRGQPQVYGDRDLLK